LHAVFDTLALFGELGEQRAVVELDGVEITVGDGDHPLAGTPLRGRDVRQHERSGRNVSVDTGERAEVHLAANDRLGFRDAIASDPQAQRHDRGMTVFLDYTEPRDLVGRRVGGLEVVSAAARADRVPEAVADFEGDVVLAVPRPLSPFQPSWIFRFEGLEISLGVGIERLARHRATLRTILPTCSPASMCAWAAPASASGKIWSISGRRRPSSTSGHTVREISSARSALKAFDRPRSVDPVIVCRRIISRAMSISTLAPPSTAIVTSRPSTARQSRLRWV